MVSYGTASLLKACEVKMFSWKSLNVSELTFPLCAVSTNVLELFRFMATAGVSCDKYNRADWLSPGNAFPGKMASR